MLWIPITLAAAALQTLRNALQRSLTGQLSALGATYTRFLFGFPFALLFAVIVFTWSGETLPAPSAAFFAWAFLGAVAQIFGTAALLFLFQLRNFATGIVLSKSEIVLAAVAGFVVLSDHVSALGAGAIVVATAGLILLARETGPLTWGSALRDLGGRPALLGLASGAGFGVAAVGFRAASLSLEPLSVVASAISTLTVSTFIQMVVMGAYLAWREPEQIGTVIRMWRRSLLPGLAGASASALWFTAMTLEIAAYVRMLGLVEVLYSYAVSHIRFRERPTGRELVGASLLIGAILALLWERAAAVS